MRMGRSLPARRLTSCWGGVYVGDDSLNRAVASLRRALAEVGGGIEIATIPRTGYRVSVAEQSSDSPDRQQTTRFSRRMIVAGSAGVDACAGWAWWEVRAGEDARFDRLIEVGKSAIRTQDANPQIIHALEEAAAIRPSSARAWGLLAFFDVILAQISEPKVAEPLSIKRKLQPRALSQSIRKSRTRGSRCSNCRGQRSIGLRATEACGRSLQSIHRENLGNHRIGADAPSRRADAGISLLE